MLRADARSPKGRQEPPMFPGPVFQFELLTLARRRRYYVMRFLYGLLLLWVVAQSYPWRSEFPANPTPSLTIQEAANAGRTVFLAVTMTQAIAVLAITPAVVAGVIADERQRKTLHYLLASCLTSAEIVVGKLASRLISTAVYLMVLVPVLGMVSFLGGIDPNDVLLMFAASASTVLFIAAYSVFASVYAKRPRDAVVSVYLAELAWLFGPAVAKALVPVIRTESGVAADLVREAAEWVGATSPFFLIFDQSVFWRGPSSWYAKVFWMIGLQCVAAVVFTLVAVWRLRPVYKAEGSRTSRWAFVRKLRSRRFLPRPRCGDDPLLWKELFVARQGGATRLVGAVLFLCVFGLIAYGTYELSAPVVREIVANGYWQSVSKNSHEELNIFIRIVVACLVSFCELGAAVVAAGALGSEREEDTWISLIATPLTPIEIVRAKLLGALWATKYMAGIALGLMVLALLLGALHPVGFALGLILSTIYLTFSAALGLMYSLRSKSTARAATAAIATLVVCNGAYMLTCIPFSFNSVIPAAGFSPLFVGGSLMSYDDLGELARVSWGSGPNQRDFLLAGVLSAAIYGAAAVALIWYVVVEFDDLIDRPSTSGVRRRRRRRRGPLEPAGAKVKVEALAELD
jgi:ABC-type transport system involved in multi-copper enzyme maturation permease subunit